MSVTDSSGVGAVIGAGTSVKGKIAGDEDLLVLGRVEGRIEIGGALDVGEGGVVLADVVAEEVHIDGVVVGHVEASERIHVGKTGRIVGDIAAPRIQVEAGAQIRGGIEMGEAVQEVEPRRREVQSVLRTAVPRPAISYVTEEPSDIPLALADDGSSPPGHDSEGPRRRKLVVRTRRRTERPIS